MLLDNNDKIIFSNVKAAYYKYIKNENWKIHNNIFVLTKNNILYVINDENWKIITKINDINNIINISDKEDFLIITNKK